jgi:hypothetical protein
MPLLSGLGVWVKLIAFTVFRNSAEVKEVSFGQPFKLDDFLSVFSEESYIFGNNLTLTAVRTISLNLG